MKSLFLTLTAAGALALLATTAHAQPGSGGPAPGTPPVAPTETPLDGGASLLLASGIGYAVRKLRLRRQAAR